MSELDELVKNGAELRFFESFDWRKACEAAGCFKAGFPYPLVRRSMSTIIAQELVSVQPMSVPAGLLFYMDYKYDLKPDVIATSGGGGGGGGIVTVTSVTQAPAIIVPKPFDPRFPHKCPHCGGAAYIGLVDVDCQEMCGG